MATFIGIGLIIVVAVAFIRTLFASPPQSTPPQIVLVQAVPPQPQEGSGAGALFLLIVAIFAAIAFFPA
jgi:hypothetical protein